MGKSRVFYTMKKGLFKDSRIFSLVLSAFLIFLILSSGPVTALEIAILAPSQAKGNEIISFPIEIKTSTGELIPITHVTLNITGPAKGIGISVDCELNLTNGGKAYCVDKIAGKATSDVNVTTQFVSPMGYGYGYLYGYWEGKPYYWGYGYGYGGYGYGYYGGAPGILRFNVTWKTPITPTTYTINVTAYADGVVFNQYKTIKLLPPKPENLPTPPKGSAEINLTIPANTTTSIDIGNNTDIVLAIMTNQSVPVNINVTTFYDNLVNVTPPALNRVKFLIVEVNPELNENLTYSIITVRYNQNEVAGLDENSLRLYKWNGTDWELLPCPTFGCVDTANNFVYANITSFSLFGIFGSPPTPVVTPPIIVAPPPALMPRISIKLIAPTAITQQAGTTATYNVTVYNDGEIKLDKVYLRITGLPRGWYFLPEEVSLERNETRALSFALSIPEKERIGIRIFTLTAYGEVGITRVSDSTTITLNITSVPAPPVVAPICGNGICEAGEDYINCPADCPAPVIPPAPSPLAIITGMIVAAATNPIVQIISASIIAFLLIVFLIRFIAGRRKPWRTSFTPSYQEKIVTNLKNQIKKVLKEE